MPIRSINPTTGEELASYPETSPVEVRRYLECAEEEFQKWRRLSIAERARKMLAAAGLLRAHREHHARLMALEMGKPITQGRAEIDKCAWVCDFYAERAAEFLNPEPTTTETDKSYVAFEPLGVILAVMPWNFPFWQVFRCAVPTLMAGNAVLLKHASNVPGCALAIQNVFEQTGLPVGLFRTLLIGADGVRKLIEAPQVKGVSLTGSVSAGRTIASHAGAHLKKTVLELGGNDAYAVLGDCDLDRAVESCVRSRLINAGQSCIAAKRFIVVRSLRAPFEEAFVARLAKEKLGDPLDEATTLGPLARLDLRDELHAQVERTRAEGAKLLTGGTVPDGKGWFYPPTVLSEVQKGMTAFEEETFGPVAAIIEARDEREAIQLANDTRFGLGAAVFTRDLARGEEIAAHQLEAGSCFVNDFVRSDPRLPFGGIKDSGYGRELAAFGIREFMNLKTVFVSNHGAA